MKNDLSKVNKGLEEVGAENIDLRKEGRYEKEMSELNVFFVKTGFPRAPKYYIMKWLADYIVKYGIDGYRIDTLKHTNEDVWK